MRALRFEKTGSLDGLTVQETPKPQTGPGEVLIQIKAAAINPSDIMSCRGRSSLLTLRLGWTFKSEDRPLAHVQTAETLPWLGRECVPHSAAEDE